MLSNRYGSRLVPSKLSVTNYDRIKVEAELLGPTQCSLLEKWYRLDENAVPNAYILQVILIYHYHKCHILIFEYYELSVLSRVPFFSINCK